MVAFKTESWIWYSVVWVIAISRLSVSQTQAYAHTHEAQSSPAQCTTPISSPPQLEQVQMHKN
jgi:methionine-rich copper-binding protein CopC